MRLALIPPYMHIGAIMHTDYQLLLPQCLNEDRRYVRAYTRARRNGHYLILDNGVAEGNDTTVEELHDLAASMMVNEIVVPDVMKDTENTLLNAHAFSEDLPSPRDIKFNYMGVVQGSSIGECQDCIHGFSALKYITTLGIPRHLLTTIGEEARIDLVNCIRNYYDNRFEIHLLGMNPTFTDELISFGRAYRMAGVRGIDTSAPFNYALANTLMSKTNVAVARPTDYFEQYVDPDTRAISSANIAIMKDWVRGNA